MSMFAKLFSSRPAAAQQPPLSPIRKSDRKSTAISPLQELCICIEANQPMAPSTVARVQKAYAWHTMAPRARVFWVRWLMEQVRTSLATEPANDWRKALRQAFPTDAAAWDSYETVEQRHATLLSTQWQTQMLQTQLQANTSTVSALMAEKRALAAKVEEANEELTRMAQERNELTIECDWLNRENKRVTHLNKRLSFALTEEEPVRPADRRASLYASRPRPLSPPAIHPDELAEATEVAELEAGASDTGAAAAASVRDDGDRAANEAGAPLH